MMRVLSFLAMVLALWAALYLYQGNLEVLTGAKSRATSAEQVADGTRSVPVTQRVRDRVGDAQRVAQERLERQLGSP